MSLRVIAGAWKGRRLIAPPGLATRPLMDRLKQSLCDWLGPTYDGLSVVDCCAGSGSFGCEVASRGAATVHLIEPARQAQSALQANLRSLGNPPALIVHPRPFQVVLPQLRGIDLVFADPPFPWFREEPDTLRELLSLATESLASGGILAVRGERGEELPSLPPGLKREERRSYGRSWVALLRRLHAMPAPASVAT